MAKIIYITRELLSLFIEGRTTVEESAVILAAAKENMEIRQIIENALDEGRFYQSEASANASAESVCIRFRRHLPATRMAANSEANDCVVKCEAYVLEQRGLEQQYDKLAEQASRSNWLQKEGTPLFNIGRLSELARLSVSRQFHGTIDLLVKELNAKCSVIVALNDEMLVSNTANSSVVNHAVVVLDIDEEEGFVELYDPQSPNSTDRYTIEAFLRSWEPAKNFYASIIERGVRPYVPHPEFVEDIPLHADVDPLANLLAENAHDIWAQERLDETKKKGEKTYDEQFMKPFSELTDEQRTSDYTTSLNTIKLLFKLGFVVNTSHARPDEYLPNKRTPEGLYIPKPIDVEGVELPEDILQLTEYLAENAHEEWARDKMEKGWSYCAQKDEQHLLHPDLVPYCELIDSEKEYDRKMAMNTLKVLYKFGYTIEKQ